MIALKPREGWDHVGCPDCGYVGMVPLSRSEDTPWCPHVERVIFRAPTDETQASERPWTQMVRVDVALRETQRRSEEGTHGH